MQRYRNDLNMLSPSTIQSNNTNKRTKKSSKSNSNNNSHPDSDVIKPQLTSNEHKTNAKSNKKKLNILKIGSIHENIEINDQKLDENLDNNDI